MFRFERLRFEVGSLALLFCGELAQLGERLFCTQEVSGSIPLFSTILFFDFSFLLPLEPTCMLALELLLFVWQPVQLLNKFRFAV